MGAPLKKGEKEKWFSTTDQDVDPVDVENAVDDRMNIKKPIRDQRAASKMQYFRMECSKYDLTSTLPLAMIAFEKIETVTINTRKVKLTRTKECTFDHRCKKII